MKLHKRILRSALIQAALARLIVLYLRLTFATTRVDRRGDEALDRIIARRRPMLMCYWHGRMGLMHLGWRWPERSCLLISRHRDGTLGHEIARLMGVRVIAGSTRRGGTSAARRMIRELGRQELFIGMMPDGPRGPRMRAGRGVVSMARLAGALIVPIVCSTSRRVVLGSWDRFILPLPFGRAVYLVGEPVDVAEAGDDERARLLVEDRLNALCRQADRLVSVAAIEPAAPTAAGATGEPAA